MATIPYSLYKILALYGENIFLPMVIWTSIGILSFTALRYFGGICSVPIPPPPLHGHCSIIDQLVDSFAAYFQFPRSTTNIYDTVERILSIPVLGTAFIAIRRKLERAK